jgi:nucleoprotein TPR
MEKVNKQQKDAITKNNQIFRQRMSTLGAENTQLKSALEAAQKESAAISEERDALKSAAPAESTSAPLTEELERLRKEKRALELALQEEKSKPPVQASVPDTSDLEARLVRSLATKNVTRLTFSPFQATVTEERDNLVAEKETWKKAAEALPEAKAVPENWEAEKAELVKNRDDAMTQANVDRPQRMPTEAHIFLYRLHERRQRNSGRRSVASGCQM